MLDRVLKIIFWAMLATFAVSVVTYNLFDSGPIHAARCAWQARDGWFFEVPADAETAADVRSAIRKDTTCVAVEVGYVDWNDVPEGHLALFTAGRDWASGGGTRTRKVWVEGSASQATDPCRPPSATLLPPAGCPGGPIPAPGPPTGG